MHHHPIGHCPSYLRLRSLTAILRVLPNVMLSFVSEALSRFAPPIPTTTRMAD
jgi:hypothetical protein